MVCALRLAVLLLIPWAIATAAEDYPRGQLPEGVRPTRYTITLEIDPHEPTFAGMCDIEVQLEAPARRIWLHGLGLEMKRSELVAGGKTIPLTYTLVDDVTGVARLDAKSDLPAGAATLRFQYAGKFENGAEGLFRSHAGEEWYVFSQFQPTDARRVFPGFDEPRFKTPFVLTVVTPPRNRAISNARIESSIATDGGKLRQRFAPTLPLPTYLLALAVGPLDVVEPPPIPPNNVRKTPLPLRGVATLGQGANLAFALRETPELIRRAEEYFQIPYPYPKLDIIASPDMSGAMENAGAVLFGNNMLLLAPDAPASQQRLFGVIAAHEYAHHWFGDYVTPAWWTDIWLNEAFAEWHGRKIGEAWRPQFSIETGRLLATLDAMRPDSRRAARPIHQTINDTREVASTFDPLTYDKGAGVLAMIESYLGEDVFRRGVQRHLKAHAHGVATSDDFFRALAQEAKQDRILQAFRSFTDQPGVPLLQVKRSADGAALELAQTRFRPLGSAIPEGGSWTIPVCVRAYNASGSDKACTLLSSARGTLALPQGMDRAKDIVAIMPNANGAGYYRFALEPEAWDPLISRAVSLPANEAVSLYDSVLAGFEAGTLKFDRVLAAAAALANHPSRQASTTLGDALYKLSDRLVPPDLQPALQRRLGEIYKPVLQRLGYDLRSGAYAGEAADQTLRREMLLQIVAFGARDKELRAAMVKATDDALKTPAALDPGLRALAWSAAVQEAPDKYVPAVQSALLTSEDSLVRSHAAQALGALEDPQALAGTLELLKDERVHAEELFIVLYGSLNRAAAQDQAWQWFVGQIDVIFGRLPGFAQAFVFGLPDGFCDAGHAAQMKARLEPKVSEVGAGALELARAIENVELCVAQKQAHAADFRAALGGQR